MFNSSKVRNWLGFLCQILAATKFKGERVSWCASSFLKYFSSHSKHVTKRYTEDTVRNIYISICTFNGCTNIIISSLL